MLTGQNEPRNGKPTRKRKEHLELQLPETQMPRHQEKNTNNSSQNGMSPLELNNPALRNAIQLKTQTCLKYKTRLQIDSINVRGL